VQAYGIAIDGIHYYSNVLRRFVGATENGRRRSFLFRRDPRDISSVFLGSGVAAVFNDPVPQHDAPADQHVGAARAAGQAARDGGRSYFDEAAIFAAYERLREREARAVSETKRTRRARERRPQPAPRGDAISAVAIESAVQSYHTEDITPFEIEEP
jgi:putative transposase